MPILKWLRYKLIVRWDPLVRYQVGTATYPFRLAFARTARLIYLDDCLIELDFRDYKTLEALLTALRVKAEEKLCGLMLTFEIASIIASYDQNDAIKLMREKSCSNNS